MRCVRCPQCCSRMAHPGANLTMGMQMRYSVTIGRLLLLFGSACVIIVVVTHIAEAFHLLPMMGWGLPNSVGHYLDLVSAVVGVTLLATAAALWALRSLRFN